LDKRKDIATKALKEAEHSKYNFSVTQAKIKDSYADVLTGHFDKVEEISDKNYSISDSKISEIKLKN
jgi:hypothetical protein